jgi:hypothetical protein
MRNLPLPALRSTRPLQLGMALDSARLRVDKSIRTPDSTCAASAVLSATVCGVSAMQP